jgi:hypothetical protein
VLRAGHSEAKGKTVYEGYSSGGDWGGDRGEVALKTHWLGWGLGKGLEVGKAGGVGRGWEKWERESEWRPSGTYLVVAHPLDGVAVERGVGVAKEAQEKAVGHPFGTHEQDRAKEAGVGGGDFSRDP